MARFQKTRRSSPHPTRQRRKKPLNGYIVFFLTMLQAYPLCAVQSVAKKAGQLWRTMSTCEKDWYKEKGRQTYPRSCRGCKSNCTPVDQGLPCVREGVRYRIKNMSDDSRQCFVTGMSEGLPCLREGVRYRINLPPTVSQFTQESLKGHRERYVSQSDQCGCVKSPQFYHQSAVVHPSGGPNNCASVRYLQTTKEQLGCSTKTQCSCGKDHKQSGEPCQGAGKPHCSGGKDQHQHTGGQQQSAGKLQCTCGKNKHTGGQQQSAGKLQCTCGKDKHQHTGGQQQSAGKHLCSCGRVHHHQHHQQQGHAGKKLCACGRDHHTQGQQTRKPCQCGRGQNCPAHARLSPEKPRCSCGKEGCRAGTNGTTNEKKDNQKQSSEKSHTEKTSATPGGDEGRHYSAWYT